METRWEFSLTEEQLESLILVNFVIDNMDIPKEFPCEDIEVDSNENNFCLENELEKQ